MADEEDYEALPPTAGPLTHMVAGKSRLAAAVNTAQHSTMLPLLTHAACCPASQEQWQACWSTQPCILSMS